MLNLNINDTDNQGQFLSAEYHSTWYIKEMLTIGMI